MSDRRYEEWAGKETPIGTVWPIVDTETCGLINGSPTPEQWCAVAFDPDVQARICRLLNKGERKEMIDLSHTIQLADGWDDGECG